MLHRTLHIAPRSSQPAGFRAQLSGAAESGVAFARRSVLLLPILVLAGCAAGDGRGEERAETAATLSAEEPGALLPDVLLPDLAGGSRPLRSDEDEVTLINFWGTWCVPCLKELPELVALYDSLGAAGLGVVGIAIDSGDPADIRAFAAEHGMIYPILTARHEWARQRFDVFGLPVTLVVDGSGRIRHRLIGPQTRARFEAAVRPFLQAPG